MKMVFKFDQCIDYLRRKRPFLSPAIFTKARDLISEKRLGIVECEALSLLLLSIDSCIRPEYVSLMIEGSINALNSLDYGESGVNAARHSLPCNLIA